MDQEPRALIKRHNEYVREQVVQDLEALEEKLNVKRQVSERTHAVVDKAKGTLGMNQDGEVHGVTDFARKNAVPLAAVGLGGAILARNATKMRSHSEVDTNTYYGTPQTDVSMATTTGGTTSQGGGGIASKAGDVKGAAVSKVSGATSVVGDKASSVKDSVTGSVASAGTAVSDASTMAAVRASEVKDAVVQKVPSRGEAVTMAKENAPVVGIAALALGALAGAFLPRTRMEEERLAPIQEQVVDKAKEAASEAADKAMETVDKAKDAVQAGVDTVTEEMSSSDTDPVVTTPNRITGAGATSTNGINYGSPAGSL